MNDFEEKVLADLAVLKSEMKTLVGNGQPGRLTHLEQRVARHEELLQRAMGIGAFLGGLMTLLHAGMDWLKWKT